MFEHFLFQSSFNVIFLGFCVIYYERARFSIGRVGNISHTCLGKANMMENPCLLAEKPSMTVALLPIIGFSVIIAVILSFRIKLNQTVTCPHCQLEFTKDLFTFQDHTLVACRFCHRWMHARSIRDRFYAEKIL